MMVCSCSICVCVCVCVCVCMRVSVCMCICDVCESVFVHVRGHVFKSCAHVQMTNPMAVVDPGPPPLYFLQPTQVPCTWCNTHSM